MLINVLTKAILASELAPAQRKDGEMNNRLEGGLEGVTVADTRLSEVDGLRGRVLLVGEPLERTAARGFASTCGLMWDQQVPSDERRRELEAELGRARVHAFEQLPALGDALRTLGPMAALRAAVARLAPPTIWPHDAIALTGAMAVFTAAIAAGAVPIAPDPGRTHAADLLRMLRGAAPDPEEAAALDIYLATVIDHGFNASTFAARVVASTEAPMGAAVLAGLGALEGRLHGGAPGPVLDMLDAAADHPDAWLIAELAAGRRIMGMGHRVYRVRDPRAAILEGAVGRLAARPDVAARVASARRVERAAEALLAERKPDRPLRANVEFFTAVLLEALGIPRALFTAIFASGRVAGWCAHVREQQQHGRLIRPRARYVGLACHEVGPAA
jgi:citrate synthase